MEANRQRNIQSGERYTHLFPQAANNTATIRKDANVYHTVAFIPKVVNETVEHTKKIAAQLKANTVYETCNNIWHFVYRHIAYKKDAEGYEQIRSPARAWHDRFKGVDCDCYSVFISSILTNLKIPHTLRITKYHRDYFQHIYPIVPTGNSHITIDCVTDKFNYEVPFSEKKDYQMDLQYLNGFDNNPALYADPNEHYLLGTGNGMEELGKIFSKRFATNNSSNHSKKPSQGKQPSKMTGKQKRVARRAKADAEGKPRGFKKILNKFNKFNPVTIALRNGVLASMKLNIKNVAGRLRWTYLTPEAALKKGIIPEKFQKLLNTRKRLENIFYKAGGKPDNLRKAILKGKGNKDRAVQGLDGFDGTVEYMNEYTPLNQLLGVEIYHSENIEGMEDVAGLGDLGEPLTLASIAAASGVIAGIAGMIKQVGDIFKKKGKGSEDFDEEKNQKAEKEAPPEPVAPAPELPEPTQQDAEPSYSNDKPIRASSNLPMVRENGAMTREIEESAAPYTAEKVDAKTDDTKGDNDKQDGFWDKNKKWLKPVAIGVGGLSLIALAATLIKSSNNGSSNRPGSKSLHGVPRKKQSKNHHRKGKQQHHKKTAVALM